MYSEYNRDNWNVTNFKWNLTCIIELISNVGRVSFPTIITTNTLILKRHTRRVICRNIWITTIIYSMMILNVGRLYYLSMLLNNSVVKRQASLFIVYDTKWYDLKWFRSNFRINIIFHTTSLMSHRWLFVCSVIT